MNEVLNNENKNETNENDENNKNNENNESIENHIQKDKAIVDAVSLESDAPSNETPIKNENSDTAEMVEALKKTVKELQDELDAYKSAAAHQEAITKQINEFSELFPDVSVRTIPDEVWENVKQGNSLAAAYSVYERKISEAARRIEQINAQNAKKSAGAAGKNLNQEFFSADDVRKMSPSEVRANYAKIRRSMEKWNRNF